VRTSLAVLANAVVLSARAQHLHRNVEISLSTDFVIGAGLLEAMPTNRRFPPPWSIGVIGAAFLVRLCVFGTRQPFSLGVASP
jgi:hypothetical protein